ncbi:site-specific DNA-methyltransferase [Clostridium perfringens]|jgi:site-specific DNA-methyltransferase (adenine-specific)|nr:site-specific DNA-methyltransferase [Clostridium perfringens]
MLIHNNSIEYLKEMKECSVDLIVTDPPYKTITGGNSDGANSKRPQGMLDGNRKLFKHQKLKISDWMGDIYRVLKEGSHCYIMTNSLNMEEMLTESRKAGFKLHNILVWEKNNCTPSQFYMKNCEYTLFLRKGKAKWINDIGGSKTVHKYNNIIGKKTHPCEKPVELMEFYIKNSSNEGDVVLDPFMGTGSVGVACLNTNRKFIGIELDDKYFDIAKERIEMINKEAC